MARFVVTNRRSRSNTPFDSQSSSFSVSSVLTSIEGARIITDNDPASPEARRVVVIEADPTEVDAIRVAAGTNVIIEPEIFYRPLSVCPLDFIDALSLNTTGPATSTVGGRSRDFTITGGGVALSACRVVVYFRGMSSTKKFETITDAGGACTVCIPPGMNVSAVEIYPPGNFWPILLRGVAVTDAIDCIQLPSDGPLAWWHNEVGIIAYDSQLGAGVKVGVIDTGVGSHDCLRHVRRVGSFIDGVIDPAPSATADVDGHGTHVIGTIGGRPINPGAYVGIAPGAELVAARVFATGKKASNADIANAIDVLSRVEQVDLINLSLGASSPSEIVRDAISDALEHGTLCIAAAGNNAGAVNYPAAFQECVSVSALGLAGWGPLSSPSGTRLPSQPDRFGENNLFLANFSCFGNEIDCAAPGVGIIGPICDRFGHSSNFFAAMDGTSMASPIACGVAAVLLSQYPDLASYPRDASRSALCRQLLTGKLKHVGLKAQYQGRGLVSII